MSIKEPAAMRRLSHAYILSAPSREESLDMARALAADALCSAGGDRACGLCRNCRKVQQGIHPDLLFVRRPVDDKGREKKEIVVGQIRNLVSESQVLPNEAERKVYVIDEAHLMNLEAQNVALKLLEEPPPRLILILCTVNANSLLPTVRSRCVQIQGKKSQLQTDGEDVELALEYLRALESGDEWRLCAFCFAHEGMDSASAVQFMHALEKCSVDMLCLRRDRGRLSAEKLAALCRLASRCRDYLRVNTGVKHIFGLLAVFAAGEG